MVCLSRLLVFIKDHCLFFFLSRSVDPHITLASGFPSIFSYQNRSLICMDNRTLVDILMKIIIKYGKIPVCTFDCPVRHVLTGDGKSISPELFFQTGKWNCVDVFSVEYSCLKRWRYKTSSQQTGWMWGFFHRISLFAGINSNMMFLYFYFCRDKTVPFVYLIRQLFPARLSK